MMFKTVPFILFVIGYNYGFAASLDKIKPQVSPENQGNATIELIKRTIPNRYNDFIVEINSDLENGKDTFIIEKIDTKIKITATTGVVGAAGFNHYLKYYCNSHIAWEVSRIDIPENLPDVNVTITLNDRFRYYQNVCTTGYSFVWWNWEQWEKHIDWIAMNAFNLVLAFNGQEAIWDRVYQKLNLSKSDIDEHFTGPAFLPWLRMGNLRGWTGPLSSAWHERSLKLQKQIVSRMRELGIITVLPAFAGHLPRAFKKLYPDVNMIKMAVWMNFNDTYNSPYFLDPTEKLFNTIGSLFMQEQIREFGTDHVYNCDSFNEMDPFTSDLMYLSNVGKSIYKAMTDVDTEAIWLMQGWTFFNSQFWNDIKRVRALLTSIPLGKMIVLDLYAEQFPLYNRLQQYFGQPYIWCMLHNFGGTLGVFGSTDILNERPITARNQENSTMIGIGLTMEGINQNYVIYEFMAENSWRNQPRNKEAWFRNYARRRYGKINSYIEKAWQILQKTILNYKDIRRVDGQYIITNRPNFKRQTWSWYQSTDLYEIWDNFISAADDLKDSSGFLHDLVDITRQVLQVKGDLFYEKLKNYYAIKNKDKFSSAASTFLGIFPDLQELLSSNKAFMLGPWIKDAHACANNSVDAKNLEYSARNQITLWGPRGEIIDYANKQWAGVVDNYFELRWNMFITYVLSVFNSNFDQHHINSKIFYEVEEPFTFNLEPLPSEPTGDTIEIAKKLYKKWRS